MSRVGNVNTRGSSGLVADGLIFAAGAFTAVLIFLSLYSVLSPAPIPNRLFSTSFPGHQLRASHRNTNSGGDDDDDSASATFYDDPNLSYIDDEPIADWDQKRSEWLRLHPAFAAAGESTRVVMVSGSQPGPCRNPVGDHMLLRFLKNKVDYCRLHGIELFYSTALLHPSMPAYWAKTPVVRAAMLAHPEAEWIWWVDSDAVFTDMDFALPLDRYRHHNFVVHGWPDLIYRNKSWVSLNAGVFLIRNCQWSIDFMSAWSAMSPKSPEYENWGRILKSTFKDKVFEESDDQSALVYMLLTEKEKWGDKVMLENSFYFQGYWLEIVSRLQRIAERHEAAERMGPAMLRRRHAEVVESNYARARDAVLVREEGGEVRGRRGWRRPFVTHFTGCQPCSGDHNKLYSGENCYREMQRSLDFADDQVLRIYGFQHRGQGSDEVVPLPFDFPAKQPPATGN